MYTNYTSKFWHPIKTIIKSKGHVTCVLRAQVKNVKMELKHKFNFKNISF